MRQIPLDISIATDWTTLPSRNHLLSVQRATAVALALEKIESKNAANEPNYLPEADMLWEMDDEVALLG